MVTLFSAFSLKRERFCTISQYHAELSTCQHTGISAEVETFPFLFLYFSFNRNLGGHEMELRLQDHLAKIFNGKKQTSKDVREHPRAMAKLWKEANRVKTVLSANFDHTAQVNMLVLLPLELMQDFLLSPV